MENNPTAIDLAEKLLKEEVNACRGMTSDGVMTIERVRQYLRLYKPEYVVSEALLDCEARCEALEVENDKFSSMAAAYEEGCEIVGELKQQALDKDARIAELEKALSEIANSKFNTYENSPEGQYGIGVTDGHRYCAKIARAALAPCSADGKGEHWIAPVAVKKSGGGGVNYYARKSPTPPMSETAKEE